MPAAMIRRFSRESITSSSMKDATSPMMKFEDDSYPAGHDQMIFDFDDGSAISPDMGLGQWDSFESQQGYITEPSLSPPNPFDFQLPDASSNALFNPGSYSGPGDDNEFAFSQWLKEPECPPLDASSSPIPIRAGTSIPQTPPAFHSYTEHYNFPQDASFSPSDFAALQLPGSASPPPPPFFTNHSKSYYDMPSAQPPSWASQLWSDPSPSHSSYSASGTGRSPAMAHSPAASTPYPIKRQSFGMEPRRRTASIGQRFTESAGQMGFQSASAPSPVHARAPGALARTYSRRAESTSQGDERDATVRRKKRLASPDAAAAARAETPVDTSLPSKSLLQPPKLAPSAWQLYFTDWISRHQATNTRKLNVAQAAKEAGQEYALLTDDEKEPYKQRSQILKEARERELDTYMRTLTPNDIKRENLFRTAQRKAGKSRKSNIKDPNAPKKPLSAYFMFLQRIRADPAMVQEVFGLETETTKQSVLAAAKWRSMTDDERKPFLAQAEQEKLDYEAARRLYEEGTVGHSSSINFSILPGSPDGFQPLRPFRSEAISSDEGEGFSTDDDHYHYIRS